MRTQKGFTLMEILFVVLIIAIVIGFAAPVWRAVRADIKNRQAKTALKKLAEARRNYYQSSKGNDFSTGLFVAPINSGTSLDGWAGQTCSGISTSGIPGGSMPALSVAKAFACGLLDWRDFKGLPYEFTVCPLNAAGAPPCVIPETSEAPLVGAVAVGSAAGAKYHSSRYYMYIPRNSMQVEEWEAED